MIEKLKRDGSGFTDETGCFWETQKDYLQTEILGLCGCGDPNDLMLYIKENLEKLDKHEWGKYEDRYYMFFVSWANDKGFAEHGTTIRCSWLTSKGDEVLKDINWCAENNKEINTV